MPPSQVRCTATSGGASAPSAFWNPTPQAGSIAIASSSGTSGANTMAAFSQSAPILWKIDPPSHPRAAEAQALAKGIDAALDRMAG